MTLCTISYGVALSLGVGTLAQISSMSVYEKYGIQGIMVLAIVALWKSAKDREDAAQKRRDEREVLELAYRKARDEKEEARAKEFVDAIQSVNTTIDSKYEKCAVNQLLVDLVNELRNPPK